MAENGVLVGVPCSSRRCPSTRNFKDHVETHLDLSRNAPDQAPLRIHSLLGSRLIVISELGWCITMFYEDRAQKSLRAKERSILAQKYLLRYF
jgi:hypothetical protein